MTDSLELGILDLDDPGYAIAIAPIADSLGYSRYWLAEHHDSSGRCASPDILAALVAGLTTRMQVGPGGVLLNFRSPFKVAEDFRLLSQCFPGRIELGLARGVAAPAATHALLDGRSALPTPTEHGRRVAEVCGLLRGDMADDHPLKALLEPPPDHVVPPQIWVLGASRESAALAARLGTALGLAEHLLTEKPGYDGPDTARYYRDHFQPSATLAAPLWSVCLGGTCADDETEAKRALEGLPSYFRSTWSGTPSQCRDQILAFARRYETCEVVLCDLGLRSPVSAKRRSFELLAEVLLAPKRRRRPRTSG